MLFRFSFQISDSLQEKIEIEIIGNSKIAETYPENYQIVR